MAKFKVKLNYRRLIYRASEGVFYVFYGLLKLFPASIFRTVASPFLRLFIYVAIPRSRVIKNLTAAFGHSYSAATKKGLARGVQDQFIENLLDCFVQMRDGDYVRRVIEIEGEEHLEAALRQNKGVIALGAHIGNFVLVGARLGVEGHRLHTLFRIPSDPGIRRIIHEFLPHYHQFVIPSAPRRAAVRTILDALKRNEIVHILGDNLKRGKISALLFGQHVPSPRGPISLALRSEAPLVPMYMVREYDGNMRLIIEPEVEMIRNGSLSSDIAQNTRRVVLYLESLIRRYPDQWNWLTVRMSAYQGQPDPEPDPTQGIKLSIKTLPSNR